MIATEFTGTSLTSAGFPQATVDALVSANAHIRFGNSNHHGYLLFDVGRHEAVVRLRAVASVKEQASDVSTRMALAVEAGRPGVVLR